MFESLYPLALLACPVGMGLMMWMMTRGHKQQQADAEGAAKQAELTRLQARIDQLRGGQDHTGDHGRAGVVRQPSA